MVALLDIAVPGSIALLGTLLTWQSNKRLAQDRRQSEARLRLDAAIHASDLFNPSSDAAGSAARSAAGLLALTQLGQADLAVALLSDLWSTEEDPSLKDAPDGSSARPNPETPDSLRADVSVRTSIGVSADTAIQVINAALQTEDPNAQVIAAELLCRNAPALDISKAIHWPSEINGKWNPELPVAAKLLIVDALVHMALVSRKTNAIRELAIRLYFIWEKDPQQRVKNCIGSLINSILPDLERLGFNEFMPDFGQRLISLDAMKRTGGSHSKHPDGYFEQIVLDRSAKLAQWAAGLTVPSTVAGMLAPASAPL